MAELKAGVASRAVLGDPLLAIDPGPADHLVAVDGDLVQTARNTQAADDTRPPDMQPDQSQAATS